MGDNLPSLKVTLLLDTSEISQRNEDAEFLAQRDQLGGGKAFESDRPTNTLSADDPALLEGTLRGADIREARPLDVAQDAGRVVSRSPAPQQVLADPDPNEEQAETPQRMTTLINNPAQAATAAEIDEVVAAADSDRPELVVSPDTRQSSIAGYLNTWRHRVEQIGTSNFPAQAMRGLKHPPTLEVAIGAQGELRDIIVRRSSGNPSLDQAALSILRMAAPFEPLPEAIRAEYDVLRFAYDWQFSALQDRGEIPAAEFGQVQ